MRPATLLVLPLLLFLALTFVLPVLALLARGITNDGVAPVLPATLAALRGWDGQALPQDDAFVALVADLRAARGGASLARAALRLNQDDAGLGGVIEASAERVAGPFEGSARAALLAADPAWGRIETWGAIRGTGGWLTDRHLLAALDLRRDASGAVRAVPEDRALFRGVFVRSFGIAFLVTAICLGLAYPTAALLARLSPRPAGLLMLAVLLPFWTGVIVRTAAWTALLARNGLLNQILLTLGIVAVPQSFLFTRFAVVVAMVHILLPFAILPAYAVMRQIPPGLDRAAASLGAGAWRRFRAVWLPQTLPGIGAGGLLVFIQALGFYVTPALLGGGGDQMLPYFIGFHASRTLDWGLAAALSILLLLAVAVLAAIWTRMIGLGLMPRA